MQHMFYVIKNMRRNLILGTDWLCQHGVRIYYDLGCMKIEKKKYVNFEEDIHVLSVSRIQYNTVKNTFCNYVTILCKGQT